MKKIITIILTLISINLFAQNPNLGTSGAQFLEIPVGARASSLGGAFVGISDDASSVFWNPAGLTRIKNNAAHFSYMNWFDMFDYNAVAASFNIDGVGTFAASLIVFSMDELEITTEEQPNGTGRFFDAQDMAIGITYSRFLTDRFAFGITTKYVRQRIWNETAEGIAFDVGTQYLLDFQNLTIAMSMRNFGADMRYEGEDLLVTYDKDDRIPKNRLTQASLKTDDYPMPLSFQVGVAMDIYSNDFLGIRASIDAVHPNDNQERVNIGSEISLFDRVYLRGGYRYNYDDEDITFGAGANLPVGTNKVSFNYGYAFYDILPSVHRISLDLEF
jgi:hypothetical protein